MKKTLIFSLLLGFSIIGFNSDAQFGKLIRSIPTPKVKTYQTYTKVHPSGTRYAGHTSGYNDPAKNVAKRDYSHHKNNDGYGKAIPDESFKTLKEARIREQNLIDKFGGATKRGGSSGNAINAIRKPANEVKI